MKSFPILILKATLRFLGLGLYSSIGFSKAEDINPLLVRSNTEGEKASAAKWWANFLNF
jgi:hypothetical protein